MKNKAADAPITFEEIVMVMIKRDKNNDWKMKPELGTIFNGKYHSK